MSEHHQLNDIQEEPSSNVVSRAPSQPTLLNADIHQSEEYLHKHSEYPSSPSSRPRRGSSVSHVDVAFFDPQGVQELRRTLTQQSIQENKNRPPGSRGSLSTDLTLTPKDGEPFDLAKTLRKIVQK